MSNFPSISWLWGSSASAPTENWPAFPDDRQSIFRAVKSRLEIAGDIRPLPAFDLPDKVRYEADRTYSFTFAPGAMDGAFGHHAASGEESVSSSLLASLTRACESPSLSARVDFHEAIPKDTVLSHIDPLLRELPDSGIDPSNLHAVARWLVTESPDREPVKLGLALLGALQGGEDTELLLTFAGHDEFTLYSAVAVSKQLESEAADRALWEMARMTDGWGRIHAIERMSAQPAPEIAAWLLAEGYANWVMYEYTAVDCATKGGLLAALGSPAPSDALLLGAGEILAALTNEAPGPWMIDYADGAEASALWVERQAAAPPVQDVRRLLSLRAIRRFARDDWREWSELEAFGWTAQMRLSLSEAADRSIRDPRWEPLVRRELDSDDRVRFGRACEAAAEFGIDLWERFFTRQRDGRDDHWWHLMQTEDRERATRVVALFEERFDLATFATGPGLELGLGRSFADASALDVMVQDLKRFPGLGGALVLAALRSPVIRNRNMALNALAAWPRAAWPAEAPSMLAAAAEIEPDPEVRKFMEVVRDGRRSGEG